MPIKKTLYLAVLDAVIEMTKNSRLITWSTQQALEQVQTPLKCRSRSPRLLPTAIYPYTIDPVSSTFRRPLRIPSHLLHMAYCSSPRFVLGLPDGRGRLGLLFSRLFTVVPTGLSGGSLKKTNAFRWPRRADSYCLFIYVLGKSRILN